MKTLYKNVLATMLTTLVTISFSACSDNGNFSNAETKIAIDVNCSTPVTTTLINSYITMLSGDVLVQAENNTIVETYFDANSTKKICLVSGNAYIIRK